MGSLNVAEWSPDQVAEWLKGLGPSVEGYVGALRARGLGGAKLLTLRCDDLEYLGIHAIGHQEIVLEAIEHLRNFQYELSRECVQQLALRVSVAAGSVARALRGAGGRADTRLETQALGDLARAVGAVKALVCWLERGAGGAGGGLRERASALLALCLEAATCAQRERFAEQPARAVAAAAAAAAAVADHIIQDVLDPAILAPASLDAVTLKQGAKPLGFRVLPSFCGHPQLGDIRFGSPAHASGAVHDGDEIVQVGSQCVIGWSGAAVERACAARGAGGELALRLRRRVPRVLPRDRNRKLPALEVKREVLLPPREDVSSSDSEPLSPPASPALPLDHTRMYPPAPRAPARRRHSVSCASPTQRRAPLGIEQFWQELQEQKWRAGGSNGQSPLPDALYRRDKAVSCSTGLELSPRPQTCLGVALNHPLVQKLTAHSAKLKAEEEEAREAKNRGKLDKSHSTPAYDFDETAADEPGSLVTQVIPESPTTPTDSPTILVHSAEKADQILDFKKSSSQIEEAILQQKNRRLTDEKNEFAFTDDKVDEKENTEVVETVNTAALELHSRRTSLKTPEKHPSNEHRVQEEANKYPKHQPCIRPSDVPPEPPPRPLSTQRPVLREPLLPSTEPIREYPVLRSVRQPETEPSSPLKPLRIGDTSQISVPLRHLTKHDIRVIPSERRELPPLNGAEPASPEPMATPASSGGGAGAPALGASFPLGGASSGGVRAIFPTYKSKSLKKKNSILAKRRSVAARALAGRGAGGAVWQRVRARHAQQPRWARRYLLLADTTLYAYRNADCSRADCMIQLAGFTAAAAREVKSRPHAFKVYHTGTAFYFAGDSADAAQAWLALIQRATMADHAPRPPGELPKQYSETEYSTESDDERPRARDKDREKEKYKDKSKFNSLKKLTHRMHRSESTEAVAGAAASLDRKYLRFFTRAKHKDEPKPAKPKPSCVPVPTEHYRSYRRVSAEAPRPAPLTYIHASNPNLLELDADFRPAPRPPPAARPKLRKPDSFVGFVTLEEFMLKKQEEERRQVYTNRVLLGVERGSRGATLQRRLQEVVPDVLYGTGECASSELPLPVQELQARSLPRAPAPRREPRPDGKPVSVKGKDGYEKIVYTEEKPRRERMRRASPPAEQLGYETVYGSPRAGERWRDSLRRNDKVHSGAGAATSPAGGAPRRPAPPAPLVPPAPPAPSAPSTPSTPSAAPSTESGVMSESPGGVSRLRLMFGPRNNAREPRQDNAEREWAWRTQYPHLQCPPTFQPESYSLARLPRPPSD